MLKINSVNNSLTILLLSINVTKVDEFGVGVGGSDGEDKTVKKSPFKNLNGAMGYLIPNVIQAFTQWRQAFIKASIL